MGNAVQLKQTQSPKELPLMAVKGTPADDCDSFKSKKAIDIHVKMCWILYGFQILRKMFCLWMEGWMDGWIGWVDGMAQKCVVSSEQSSRIICLQMLIGLIFVASSMLFQTRKIFFCLQNTN